MDTTRNPLGLQGISFVEYAAPDAAGAERLHRLFTALGFSRTRRHRARAIDLYQQGNIRFLLNRDPETFAHRFAAQHGPCISAMGWRVENPAAAHDEAVKRGATHYAGLPEYESPAIYGIGDSLLHLVRNDGERAWDAQFMAHPEAVLVPSRGFLEVDHLTNNVPQGTLGTWQRFYKDVFGFTDVRRFDIEGRQTGLVSYALRSPDGSFCIPINEGTDKKSQINEYLEEYRGPGVQHLALLSQDLLASLDGLQQAGVETLDIDDEYYRDVFQRVPGVTEDHARIKQLQVLVDGDDKGYLLQIFTKNVIGPIFFEMIQRRNHLSFGEGNFSALFRSIERDQEKRGYLSAR